MKQLMTILALGLCLVIGPSLLAQEEGLLPKNEAIVNLKGGTKLRGEIKEWKLDEYIVLIMPWGGEVKLTNSQIKNIVQIGALEQRTAVYNFNETGMYLTAKSQLITGNEGPRAKGIFGIGFSASIGHKFNRYLGLGGGIGYDKYIWASGESLIPIFAEVSGFFTPTNTSLFYNLQVGYSLAQANDAYLLREAKGGLLIYPSIGIRFGKENTKMTFDVGYKFQKATFTYEDIWTRTTNSKQDVLFKRLSVRIGIYL